MFYHRDENSQTNFRNNQGSQSLQLGTMSNWLRLSVTTLPL